jgi:hypothetical protein
MVTDRGGLKVQAKDNGIAIGSITVGGDTSGNITTGTRDTYLQSSGLSKKSDSPF